MALLTNTFAKYLRLGFIPRNVRGNWDNGDLMYSFYHDDVQYTIDDTGDYEEKGDASYLVQCLKNREMIIDRNHETVAKVYSYIKKQFGEDIWVLIGSGPQLHVSFGKNDGIIAALLMDFKSPEEFEYFKEQVISLLQLNSDEVPDIAEMDTFILAVQEEEYDAFFTEFELEGIEVQLCSDDAMWGDHDGHK